MDLDQPQPIGRKRRGLLIVLSSPSGAGKSTISRRVLDADDASPCRSPPPWGASTDLFAMGAAEEVHDEALIAKPLANPGLVVKQSRGLAADYMAATSGSPGIKPRAERKSVQLPRPRPSRSAKRNVDDRETPE